MSDEQTAAPEIVTALDRPEDLLPCEISIESDEQVEQALRELAFIDAHSASVSHQIDEQVRKLRQEQSQRLQLRIDDVDVPYAQRRRDLETALESYVRSSRPQLPKAKGKKSEEFRHGVVGFREQRSSVGYAEKKDHKSAISAINSATGKVRQNKGGLKQRLQELGRSLRLFARDKHERMIALFVDLQPKVNLTRAKQCVENGDLTKAQLRKFGLVYDDGGTTFYATPTQYEAKRQR